MSGSGGRSVAYDWKVRTSNGGDPPDKAEIEAQISGPFVQLNKTFVKENYDYEFVLEVTNFLNQKKTTIFKVKRENKEIPSLDVEKIIESQAVNPTEIKGTVK